MAGYGKRPRRLNYSVYNLANKSGNKTSNAIKHFQMLQRRIKIEGQTAWLTNALAIVRKKFKKYCLKESSIS
jgi:hypothetical protein